MALLLAPMAAAHGNEGRRINAERIEANFSQPGGPSYSIVVDGAGANAPARTLSISCGRGVLTVDISRVKGLILGVSMEIESQDCENEVLVLVYTLSAAPPSKGESVTTWTVYARTDGPAAIGPLDAPPPTGWDDQQK